MKYFATYLVFDREAGANPLYHSCILLSKTDEGEKQLEVVDNWGFYGLPTTGDKTTLVNKLKLKIGMDVDLQGNHGMLRHEEIRFLDLGYGLHGVTFELTQEKFNALQTNCLTMVAEQESAIKEVVDTQGIKGKPLEETRIYPQEQYSQVIYQLEKIKAAQKGQPPRLKPFELCLTFGLWGPGLETSNTCKSQAIALLSTVLSKEQIDRLTEGGSHPTVPRFSGPMEDNIILHSTGTLRQHKKSDGSIVYYRDWKDADVKLFWTLPPQELEALTEDTVKRFEIDEEYCTDVKSAVRKLQSLEWLFHNAVVPEHLKNYKELLIEEIIASYKGFFSIEPKQQTGKINGWQGFAMTLFSLPRDKEEMKLLEKLKEAKKLFNSLYMAMADNWEIDGNSPLELDESENQNPEETSVFYNSLEAIAAYLSKENKIKLCQILGRTYTEDDSLTDEEISPGPLVMDRAIMP